MSDLASLKITIENEANYLLFGSRICPDINELAAFCRNRYQDLQKNVDDFLYYWIDDDGDAIRITTDEDYQSFLQAMANVKARLYVADKNATVAETSLIKEEINVQAELDDAPMQNVATGDAVPSRPVHQHAICDVCDGQIVGHRYKCLTCHDYDLCMGCEAKFRHKDHLMLRIPKPVMVNRSQSTVSRMLDKLRVYSARIASTIERDLGPEGETNATAGNESAEITGTKRANARSVHRSKHSDERRTTETSKSSRGGKLCGNDRKQNSAAETSDERCSKDTKEKSSVPTASDYMRNCRDMMYMYMNSIEPLDSAGKSASWTAGDHVTVANVAAATAAAAAARATALANNVMNVNVPMKNGKSTPSQFMIQPVRRVDQIAHQTHAPKQQKPPMGPPTPSVVPLPFLPFVNLTWPTQEKLLVASENVSKLLDPLGLCFEIRHKSSSSPSTSPGCAKARSSEDGGAVPSTSASVADTTAPIPTTSTVESSVQQEQNKATETEVSPAGVENFNLTKMQALQTLQAQANRFYEAMKEIDVEIEMANSGAKKETPKAENAVSAMLESDSACEKKPDTGTRNEVDDEDDSQNTSSASLLTDDDQDLLEVSVDGEKAFGPSKPPVQKEKSWTLIDLPMEHDEEKIANATLDAIAKLIGHDLSSPDKEPSQPQVPPSKDTTNDKTGDHPKKNVTFISAADDHHSYDEMTSKRKSEKSCDVPQPEPLSLEEGMEKREKELLLLASSSNSGPSTSSSSGNRSGKSSRKTSSAQQKDSTIYSHRPHVNHAIHTMMTMGFSNHNGWLTQLLESLNGDIPKALDMLLQHRH
ncbi:protein ref(2)P [Anopheles moucheti]|uniref:protein ref(2)P n=1 Tax=Anopheles moucheti TaxID=186751 RepID=UPI0022F0E88E|nr:protein ref(2)P [Anopheles moucheti]